MKLLKIINKAYNIIFKNDKNLSFLSLFLKNNAM